MLLKDVIATRQSLGSIRPGHIVHEQLRDPWLGTTVDLSEFRVNDDYPSDGELWVGYQIMIGGYRLRDVGSVSEGTIVWRYAESAVRYNERIVRDWLSAQGIGSVYFMNGNSANTNCDMYHLVGG